MDNEKIVSDYIDKITGEEYKILDDRKLSEDEMKYLISVNKYDGFKKYKIFKPEINKSFFAIQLYVSGSSKGFGWNFSLNLFNLPRRITILEDDCNKKYRQEFVEWNDDVKNDDKLTDGKYRIDEHYVAYGSKICPDENVTCNCGCYNNNPISVFPWNDKNNNWIIAPTMQELELKCEIFFKHFNFDIIQSNAYKYIAERKNKIDSLLEEYGEYYK